MSINVTDSEIDISSILTKLGYEGSKREEVMQSDMLLLPDNVDSPESSFPDKSLEVKNVIGAKLRVSALTRQGVASHYEAERAADIVLPVLLFLSWAAFDIGKDILANMLYDWGKQHRYEGKVPSTKVKCIVFDSNGNVRRELRAEGPADAVAKALREFKPEK